MKSMYPYVCAVVLAALLGGAPAYADKVKKAEPTKGGETGEEAKPFAPPEMPKPQKEHEWLQKLVGEWESESEMTMDPQAVVKGTGSEKARALGGFWVISESTGTWDAFPGEMHSVLTLGYDPKKGKFVGTWVDSEGGYLWNYEGTLDAGGTTLTLETKGPCPMKEGAMSNFRDVLEFKDADHRVFSSSIQNDDGTWTKMMTQKSTRKK